MDLRQDWDTPPQPITIINQGFLTTDAEYDVSYLFRMRCPIDWLHASTLCRGTVLVTPVILWSIWTRESVSPISIVVAVTHCLTKYCIRPCWTRELRPGACGPIVMLPHYQTHDFNFFFLPVGCFASTRHICALTYWSPFAKFGHGCYNKIIAHLNSITTC